MQLTWVDSRFGNGAAWGSSVGIQLLHYTQIPDFTEFRLTNRFNRPSISE